MALLEIKDLHVEFKNKNNTLHAVKGISFDVNEGEVVGLVGESGSGKTVTAFSILKLIEYPGIITKGTIIWKGADILTLPKDDLRNLRGNDISMIFQDPFGSLNPVYSVGAQIAEVIQLHQGMSKDDAWDETIRLLTMVKIPDSSVRAHNYPHQFSGGMCQRVMIAMALACKPELIIADEPTTSLDVTIQAEIVNLLMELKNNFNMSILFISHDLGLVSQICDRVIVLKEGQIVEQGKTRDIYVSPQTEYTKKLIAALPVPKF